MYSDSSLLLLNSPQGLLPPGIAGNFHGQGKATCVQYRWGCIHLQYGCLRVWVGAGVLQLTGGRGLPDWLD